MSSHFLTIIVALAWLLIGVGCWLGWQLLRQNGRILLRLDELEKRLDQLEFGEADESAGLPVGSDAPGFELPNLAGETMALSQLCGQPVLLIFFNPACGFCRELAPKLAALGQRSEEDQRLVTSAATVGAPLPAIISTGDAEKNRQFFSEHKLDCPVLLQKQMEVAAAYKVSGTPTGYLVSAEGKIASELAIGADALLALANGKRGDETRRGAQPGALPREQGAAGARATRFGNRSLARSKIKRDGLKVGTPAPSFQLPRLDGGQLALEDLRGRPVLLVVSDPHCGPCNALAPQFEKFHRDHPEMAVVMISRGEPKENRAKVKEHELTFPVVLQAHWEISRLYAMFATPIAYLIDESGIIAANVAVGVEPILALMKKVKATDLVQELAEA